MSDPIQSTTVTDQKIPTVPAGDPGVDLIASILDEQNQASVTSSSPQTVPPIATTQPPLPDGAPSPMAVLVKKPDASSPPPKSPKKSRGVSVLIAGILVLLLSLPLVVSFMNQKKQTTDVRSKAAGGPYPTFPGGGSCGPGSAGCCEGKSPGTVTCGGAVGSCFLNGINLCGFQFASVCPAGECVREGSGGGNGYWPGKRCNSDGSGYTSEACNAGDPNTFTCGCDFGNKTGDIGPMTCWNKTTGAVSSKNPNVANCSSNSVNPTPTPTPGGPTPTPGGPTPTPGGPTPTPGGPTPTPTPGGQCTRIKIYKDNVEVTPTTLKAGDAVVLAVAGANASKGRIRVNGGSWNESSTLNAQNEYTVAFTIPANTINFSVEAEVLVNGAWK